MCLNEIFQSDKMVKKDDILDTVSETFLADKGIG